jgi:dTDP-4-dehydrorhamnose 3,5-epimerase
MHYQIEPHEENKFVSCVRGEIYDVVLDLRPASPSRGLWIGSKLTAEGFETVFVPKGCAHGFLTLSDDTVVQYDISEFHHPQSARGVRYDDPSFGVKWPEKPVVISAHDLAFPPYGDR